MTLIPKIISILPIFADWKQGLQRAWLDRVYEKDITVARNAKDKDGVESLEWDRRFELELHDEEEDTLLTKALLSKARRLRVPVPHQYNEDKSESDHWYFGHYTGVRCLTTLGVAALREEIRKELRAKHEARAHWVVWISAFTGVVGAITGLVALLGYKVT